MPAPDFTLANHEGVDTSLAALLGHGPLVLYFYPADFTPVCTAEACTFRDLFTKDDAEIEQAGLTLAGVSAQGPESHRKFRERFKLPFPLLSDPSKSVIKAYEAMMPFGLGTRRVTYLIGQDRKIADAVESNLGVGKHKAFVTKAIEFARDKATPAG